VSLFVPDASVLLKWVLPGEREPHLDKALNVRESFLLGRIDLLVPDLWIYEVGNILSRHFPEDAENRLEALIRFGIPQSGCRDACWKMALCLVIKHRVSFYDASYHALAVVNEGVFLTADETYVKKVGTPSEVQSLAKWQDIV
jgi:predicted nucleic acid-binding protein